MIDDVTRNAIQATLNQHPVVLYMKGTRAFPQCGFSARVVQLLEEQEVDFVAVDVLADPTLRQGIKDYSSWPTFPQLFVKGELVGGCDIVSDLHARGELSGVLRTV
jgi:monothiol glutaredoxin